MKATKYPVQGPLLVEPRCFADDRGFFTERFRTDQFAEVGIPGPFVQDNFSLSKPGVLRGLHYQHTPAQGKLVTCVAGRIFDVAVDIRADSPTFGQWIAEELDANTPRWLWIPAGFAHGFCVLGDQEAAVLYKVDNFWAPSGEGGLRWNDPALNIPWPIATPLLSGKDLILPGLNEYRQNPAFRFSSPTPVRR